MIKLRAHHINCLFFYKGFGYNKEFTLNMDKLKDLLIKNPLTTFKLINECDDLCSKCPNILSSNSCISNEKILQLDSNTLNSYNLELNKSYTFQFIIENIYNNFDCNKFESICSSCEWYKKDVCNKNSISEHKIIWSF